jgi:CheY-like chemotaxis protein
VIRSSSSKRARGNIWSHRRRQFCDWLQPIFVCWPSRLFTLEIRASYNAAREQACDDRGVGVSVLIVDDHAEFRRSARALLEADGYTVVGEAGDGDEAIAEAGRLRPEIVLLDIQLPGIDGFAVAERLASSAHPPAVVLISSRDARSYGPRLARAPARGFVSKADLSGEALSSLVS